MAESNKLTLTKPALTKICRDIINDRTYDKSLISIAGNLYIEGNEATGFSPSDYFYWNYLETGFEELVIGFKGIFTELENSQCAWALTAPDLDPIILTVTSADKSVAVTYKGNKLCEITKVPIKDGYPVSIKVRVTSSSCEIAVFCNDEFITKESETLEELPIPYYEAVQIGAYDNSFWYGNINIAAFSITNGNRTVYTPSTGPSFSLTKIMVSDGKYPLTNDSMPVLYHVYEAPVQEIARSGNTVLISAKIDADSYLNIKQIGLYDTSDNEQLLVGTVDNLNINKSEGLPYDLIFTVDLSLGVANIAVADIPIVINKEEYAHYADYAIIEDYFLYVVTNLERIIDKNAYELGYNRPQVFYRYQQEIIAAQNCYNTLDTYTKLENKYIYDSNKIFDPSSVQVVGNPIIQDGLASNFSLSNYLTQNLYIGKKTWETEVSFTTNNIGNNMGCVGCFASPCINQPLEVTLSSGKCHVSIGKQEQITVGGLNPQTYYRNPLGDTGNLVAWSNETYFGKYVANINPTLGSILTNPVVSIDSTQDYLYTSNFSTAVDTTRAWSISMDITFDSMSGTQFILDGSSSTLGSLSLWVYNGTLAFGAYESTGTHDPIFSPALSLNNILTTNKEYTIQIGFTGYSYYLKCFDKDLQEEQQASVSSNTPCAWGDFIIGCSYFNSQGTLASPLMGSINLNTFLVSSNYKNVWIAADSIETIYTSTTSPATNDIVYDSFGIELTYSDMGYINSVVSGKIYDDDLFTFLPGEKYSVKVTSEFDTGNNNYVFKLYKAENEDSFSLVQTETSQVPANLITKVFVGVHPEYNNLLFDHVSNPLSCKSDLLEWYITYGEVTWDMNEEEVSNKTVKQFYNIPRYPFYIYKVSDLSNFNKYLDVYSKHFEGSGDLINFNNPNGISLFVKAHLDNTDDKVILVKKKITGEVSFILKFENKTLSFVIYSQENMIELKKELDDTEYDTFVKNPILITLTYNGSNSTPILKLYRNNEEISFYQGDTGRFLTGDDYLLMSCLDPDEEDNEIHVTDIILMEGTASEEDIYLMCNLMDTNR